jgi:Icc protein
MIWLGKLLCTERRNFILFNASKIAIWSSPMKNIPLRIAQISDIHLFGDKNQAILGVKNHESFQAVLNLLKKDPTLPHFILLTGDLAQDESTAAYLHLADELKDFPIPIYWIPGNHDNTQLLEHLYPRENISNDKHIVLEHWQIILLDSKKPGAVEGQLNPEQLKFLQHCLDTYPDHHAIVVFHHHPIPVGCAWLDNLGLTNAADLWQLLSHYPRVNTILFGHVHQQHEGEKNGIHYFSTPSTCIQFKRNSEKFALEKLGAAYRWIDLYPNGELKTGICRTDKYIGVFDPEAKGY